MFAIFHCACFGNLYLSFTARTTRPPGSPNQANRRRRPYQAVTASGSTLPNQAGDESGKRIASSGHLPQARKEGGRQVSLFSAWDISILVGAASAAKADNVRPTIKSLAPRAALPQEQQPPIPP